jgi:hypothetical protein
MNPEAQKRIGFRLHVFSHSSRSQELMNCLGRTGAMLPEQVKQLDCHVGLTLQQRSS